MNHLTKKLEHALETKKLTLYTNHLSPNGLKVSIYLEELKLVDPKAFDYKIERVNLQQGEHKKPAFLALNPTGRIPVLVDHSYDQPFTIFESSAILLYLEQNYDRQKRFSVEASKFPREYSLMLQWIFFGHGTLTPMQGQAHFFLHYAPVDVPYGKKKYHDETRRLYSVLNQVVKDHNCLIGPRFTVADISIIPWVRLHKRAGIENLDEWPSLKAWLSRSLNRPGVQAAIQSIAL